MRLLVTWKDLTELDLKLIQRETKATLLRGNSQGETLELAPYADVIFGFVSPEILKVAVNCQWLQTPYAGAEKILGTPWGNPKMIYTNGRGIFGAPIGEHVVGLILSFNRGLYLARDNQRRRLWEPRLDHSFRELTGSTVGILGYGDLGSQVAKRLRGFECKIIGFRQYPQGNESYADVVYSLDQFDEFAPHLDYLVCALPHTEKTVGFLHKKRMQLLPEHVIIINVGRGSLIRTEDLILALQEGWIGGAALDVTDPEPLPTDSPLWEMDNVLITPHNSGFTPFHKERALEIFFKNWKCFQEDGAPKFNVVNRKLGY
ncbi:MAG: D-2-hydroxyacid dehydrogenase [Firmicutes bacterium]|nr:D-2-hydroxyacid dehydrogenase [Bacillota bacterium]